MAIGRAAMPPGQVATIAGIPLGEFFAANDFRLTDGFD